MSGLYFKSSVSRSLSLLKHLKLLTSPPSFLKYHILFVPLPDKLFLAPSPFCFFLWSLYLSPTFFFLNLRVLVHAVFFTDSSNPSLSIHRALFHILYVCVYMIFLDKPPVYGKIANYQHTAYLKSHINPIFIPYAPFWLFLHVTFLYFSYLFTVFSHNECKPYENRDLGLYYSLLYPHTYSVWHTVEWTNRWLFINHPCVDGIQTIFQNMCYCFWVAYPHSVSSASQTAHV